MNSRHGGSISVTAGRYGQRSINANDGVYRRGRGKSYRGGNRGNRGGNCYNCGGSGHFARDCTNEEASGGRGGGNRNSGYSSNVDEHGDYIMDGGAEVSSRRYTPYGSRQGRAGGNRGRYYDRNNQRGHSDSNSRGGVDTMKRLGLPMNSRGGHDNKDGWYSIKIPNCKDMSTEFIMQMIKTHCDLPFVPVQVHLEGNSLVFHVQGQNVANALKQIGGKVTLPTGYKMLVISRPSSSPVTMMNEQTLAKIKEAMGVRYDAATKLLDLSDFNHDARLNDDHIFISLSRAPMLSEVIKIVQDNIPELVSLDLSKNHLTSLEILKRLIRKTPTLTRLDLGKNTLRGIHELDKIRDWNLTELVLNGNSFCDAFDEKSAYISAVRKRFPKLLKLDGHDLPPPITFDLETSTVVPATQGSQFVNETCHNLIIKFLKQYYDIFDSDVREPLLEAYHDDAVFTMCFGFNKLMSGKLHPLPDMQDSHNLLRIRDSSRRNKQVKQGKSNIITFLSSFIRTQHDLNSFIVDNVFVSETAMMFSVTGVFKQTTKSDKGLVYYFTRTFVTVPQGAGIVVTNDMLNISNATEEQAEKWFKNPAPTPSSSPVPSSAPLLNPLEAEQTRREEMVRQFSVQSAMNLEWSLKCLEENGWEYEKAGHVFTQLQAEGKIPMDAFIKAQT